MNEVQTFIKHFLREHDFSAKFFFYAGKGLRWTGKAFLVKKFRPQGKGFFFAGDDFLDEFREGFQKADKNDNDEKIAEEVAEGNLLGNAGRERFQKGYTKWKDQETDQGPATFENEMCHGASLAIDVGDHAAEQGRCRRAHICPQEDREGVVNGNEALLPEDDEDTDRDC
jgi:hypothetical protein